MSPRYQTSNFGLLMRTVLQLHDWGWKFSLINVLYCCCLHSVNSPLSSLLSSINLDKLKTYVLKLFGGEFIKNTKAWHYSITWLVRELESYREPHASLSGFETHGSPGSMRARQQWSLFIIISIPVDSGGFILPFLIQVLAPDNLPSSVRCCSIYSLAWINSTVAKWICNSTSWAGSCLPFSKDILPILWTHNVCIDLLLNVLNSMWFDF